MNVVLLPAQPDDLQAILEIVNYAILHTTANYSYEPQSLETQQKWFADKKTHGFPVIVAVLEEEVIGFGTYGTFREKVGYRFTVEHSIYVAESHIGKGIGKQLLTALIKQAKTEGFHTMIGVIDAANEDSIAFHKKFGFTECGIIRQCAFKFDRWLDTLFMQLLLK